jgi:hypothetical protein
MGSLGTQGVRCEGHDIAVPGPRERRRRARYTVRPSHIAPLTEGTKRSSLEQLTDWIQWADRVLVF